MAETDEREIFEIPPAKELTALEALRNIEMSGQSKVYVDEEGNLTYESRFARNP